MTANNGNLTSVNLARGLAALGVFVYHYQLGAVLAKYTGIDAFNWIAWPGANLCVPLFFVISGYCIHGSEWRRLQRKSGSGFAWTEYLGRRVRRIYPMYMLALLFSCLLAGINQGWPSMPDIAAHLLFLHGFSAGQFNTINVVLWTVSIEACFYVIYPFWLRIRMRFGLGPAYFYGTILSVCAWAGTAVLFYPYGLPARWFFLNTWGGWLLGALLAETLETNPDFYHGWRWWALGTCLWSLGLCAEAFDLYRDHWLILKFPIRIYMCAWPFSALLLCENQLAASRGIIGHAVSLFSRIGLASYSLYLLHEPLIEVRNVLQDAASMGALRLPFQVVWFFAVIFLCWLSYQHVELKFMKPRQKASMPLQPPHPERN